MTGPLARLRSLWRGVSRPRQLDAEMDEEMRFHIEMHAERLMREQGLELHEARRRAYVEFGGVEKYKEEGRDTRALRWIDGMSLDCRLGVRMLVKYPALTLIGGFAMAVAIAIGATFFEVITEALQPAIPVEDGERVVSLQYATDAQGSPERRVLHDFAIWRKELVSVQQLGAFRTVEHNLSSEKGHPEPVRVGEITASGFVVARTPPLLGRYLLPDDEREGAPAVVLIGHQVWKSRFAGDPGVVGRPLALGAVRHLVVGVMPEGFEFPINHQFWIPLQANPSPYQRLQGPALYVFGRLAPGVTLEAAQAELTILGQRTATAHPDTHGRLRPVILPYTREHLEIDRPQIVWALRIAQLLIGALLVVVSVNLAILVYARTVTRLGEIAVRSALGASRVRILGQLFMEAFALSVLAAATGLVLAHLALDWIQSMVASVEHVPFWITFDLSAGTVLYALGLAVLAAFIMGVLPGLKATGRQLHTNLRTLTGGTGMQLGRMWTSLIVAQVAIAVAILPLAVYIVSEVVRMEVSEPGFPADEFAVALVDLKEGRQRELISLLQAEPRVAAVTVSSGIPGFEAGRRIAFEDGAASPDAGTPEVNTLRIGLKMFDVYGAEILAGRSFDSSDLGTGANSVIVNRTFARQLLGSQSTLGQRFSFSGRRASQSATQPEWHQIVGIVTDFPSFATAPGSDGRPTVYHPAAPGEISPAILSVRFHGRVPTDFIGRLRHIGAEIDPTSPLRDVTLLTEFYSRNRAPWRVVAWGLSLVTASVLLLSAAGLYALMSLTVSQRTREIGIRTALGAHPRRILISIFGRVLRQLALGLLIGSLLSGALFTTTNLSFERAAALLLAVGSVMLFVGLLSAIGPARRGLRIQPTEALRADA